MDDYQLSTQKNAVPTKKEVTVIVKLILSIISLFKKKKDGKKPL